MTKTKLVNYKDYTDEYFKDEQDFQDFLHAGGKLKFDYVIVGGILYTMEEYDIEGKTVIWANRKYKKQMSVDTSNRYGEMGYKDAIVSIYPTDSWRNDISYAE